MAEICDFRPTLPRIATSDDEICDRHGNKWVYDDESNTWISKGTISPSGLVSEDANGLVTPDIYDRLRKLEILNSLSGGVAELKLLPGTDAYWYYFKSSDKLFKFRQEGENALRIEVDKGRMFQILMKEVCPGARGLVGPKGDTGPEGKSGAPEVCYEPLLDRSKLDFAIFTPTPLLSDSAVSLPGGAPDISVRIYSVTEESVASSVDQLNHLAIYYNQNDPRKEILPKFQATRDLILKRVVGDTSDSLCDIALSPVVTFSSDSEVSTTPIVTIEINPEDTTQVSIDSLMSIDEQRTLESIKFDEATGVVCGSVFLIQDEWSDVADYLCVRSRQKGPTGIKGDPGECKIKIIECTLDDTSVRATCPVMHARMDCEQETIFTLCSDLLNETSVENVSLVPESATLANTSVFKSVFAAAEMTLDEYKRFDSYEVDLEEDEVPELDLLHWDPQPGCFTRRHYDRHKFDWVPDTDIPKCDPRGTWYDPDDVRPGKYPYKFVTAPVPPADECCQDEFFWCPNVQDGPCVESQNIVEPSLQMGTKSWNQRT